MTVRASLSHQLNVTVTVTVTVSVSVSVCLYLMSPLSSLSY